MSAPVISVQKLRKHYGERTILEIEHLELYAGEIVAVIGPSGVGKSTLLRLCNLLESADSGEIRVNGRTVSPRSPDCLAAQREMAQVHQHPVMLDRSLLDNVEYVLRVRGLKPGECRNRALEVLGQMGLSPLTHARATRLSGGEMQRAAVARALVVQPRILFLDEPTANLDPANARLIEQTVRERTASQKMGTLLVTHNLGQAKRLADRVIFLWHRIIEEGTTQEVLESPQHEWTKAFVDPLHYVDPTA